MCNNSMYDIKNNKIIWFKVYLVHHGKKRTWSEVHEFHFDNFNKRVICDLMQEFYDKKKQVPTAPKLLYSRINFPWEIDTLRNLLLSMAFQWKSCGIRRKRPDIISWRSKYLSSIKKYIVQCRTLFILMSPGWTTI